jgi:hypothetical protein
LLGSTAETLMRVSGVPVIVVPYDAVEPNPAAPEIDRKAQFQET